MQFFHVLHFSTIYIIFYNHPLKIPEELNMENEGFREWTSSSLSNDQEDDLHQAGKRNWKIYHTK
jgi:hypothetical protein